METTPNAPTVVLCELSDTGLPGVESYSPFCVKVHRALKLARVPYTSRHGGRPDEFSDLNPTGQVPVLVVDEVPIADSSRILRRIAELAPRAGLEPDDPRARAEAWIWEDWADRALNGWLVAARWAEDANWPRVRDAYFAGAPWFVRTLIVPRVRARVLRSLHARDVTRAGMTAARDDFRRVLDALEHRAPLEGFWLGDRPTVADLAIFAQLHSLRTPLTPREARELAVRPVLTDWLDRVDEASGAAPAAQSGAHPKERAVVAA